MTITEMLDILLPYTFDDMRCGIRKANKGRKRLKLAKKIRKYRGENKSDEDILKMLNG